jgi:competence protein ComEA
VPLSARRSDDADVIRARLRHLLAETQNPGGWVPDDDVVLTVADDPTSRAAGATEEPDDDTTLPDGIGRHRSPATAVRWSPGQPGARSLWLVGIAAALALVV